MRKRQRCKSSLFARCSNDVNGIFFLIDNKQYCSQIKGHQDSNKWRKTLVKHSSIPFKGRELPLRKLFETQTQDKPFELKYTFELRYTNFTNFWHILLNWDILILMYKVKNSLAPEHICNMFFQQDKHYNLRSDFPVPRYNTVKYGKHSIRYLGPHI